MSLVPRTKFDAQQMAYEEMFGQGNVCFHESLNGFKVGGRTTGFRVGDKITFRPISGVPSITSGTVKYIMEIMQPKPHTFFVVENNDRRVRIPSENVTEKL